MILNFLWASAHEKSPVTTGEGSTSAASFSLAAIGQESFVLQSLGENLWRPYGTRSIFYTLPRTPPAAKPALSLAEGSWAELSRPYGRDFGLVYSARKSKFCSHDTLQSPPNRGKSTRYFRRAALARLPAAARMGPVPVRLASTLDQLLQHDCVIVSSSLDE